MFTQNRDAREIEFTFEANAATSDTIDLEQGCFGTLLVPAGSQLIGRQLNFVAVASVAGRYADTPLLATPKTLVAGANPLTADEIAQVGAIQRCRLSINTAVTTLSRCCLLWKA